MSVVSPPSTDTRVGNAGAGGGASAGQLYLLSNIAWATSNISINTLQSSRLFPAIASGTQRPFSWFHSKKFRTIVVAAGTGASAASITSPNSSSGQNYSYRYDTYSTVQLSCTPASGRIFLWWTNNNPGSGLGVGISDANPLTLASTDLTSDSFFNLWCVCGVNSPYSYTMYYDYVTGCMDPESDLITETGTIKAKDLKVGDLILSSSGYQRVALVNITTQPTYRIETEKKEVVVSASHEFVFVEDRKKAQELVVGDYLTTVDGPEAVTGIKFLGNDEVVEISVEPDHTYYVNGILSHNKAITGIYGWSSSSAACDNGSISSYSITVYSPDSSITTSTRFYYTASGQDWDYPVASSASYFYISSTSQWVQLTTGSDYIWDVDGVGTCSFTLYWTFSQDAFQGDFAIYKNSTLVVGTSSTGSSSITYNASDSIQVTVYSVSSKFLFAIAYGTLQDTPNGVLWSGYEDLGSTTAFVDSGLQFPSGTAYADGTTGEY